MSDEPKGRWEETNEDAALPGDPGVDWEDEEESEDEGPAREAPDRDPREEMEPRDLPLDLDA